MTERPGTSPSQALVWLAVGAGLLLGVWLRAVPLANALLFGDELHSLTVLELPWSMLLARYDAVGSGLALPLVQKGLVDAFGASLPVLRAVAFVPSLLLIAAVARLARTEADTASAWVAALIVALAPVFVFYGHFGRSYSLAALLCIGVQILSAPGPGDRRPAWSRAGWIALVGGLAAFAHLTSVFFLLGLGLGVFARAVVRGGAARLATHPVVVGFAGSAVVALALHAAAFDSLLAFVGAKGDELYYGDFGAFDVIGVLAGSSSGAALCVVALVASAIDQIRTRGVDAAPLCAAVYVPPVLLWLASPFGDAYAYARYLLPSAAAASVLIALGSVRLGRALRARVPALPVEAVGIGVAVALFVVGPRGPFAPPLDRFANTYLGLFELPAFTAGDVKLSPAYAALEGSPTRLVVVEAPPLPNRSMHYLAALTRRHGHDVRVGTFGALAPGVPRVESELYVDVAQLADGREGIDALIVHRDIADEVERYWADVYSAPLADSGRALMERHRVYGRDLPAVGPRVIEQLTQLLGPPNHDDGELVVWRFTETQPKPR